MKYRLNILLVLMLLCVTAIALAADDDPLDLTPVTANADWTPIERDFDGVTMALVPPGCFMMGSDGAQMEITLTTLGGELNAPTLMLYEQPAHEICFDSPFWIDRAEVTQADFAGRDGIQAQLSRFQGMIAR